MSEKTCGQCKWASDAGASNDILCRCELAYFFRRGLVEDTDGVVPRNNAPHCPAFDAARKELP